MCVDLGPVGDSLFALLADLDGYPVVCCKENGVWCLLPENDTQLCVAAVDVCGFHNHDEALFSLFILGQLKDILKRSLDLSTAG